MRFILRCWTVWTSIGSKVMTQNANGAVTNRRENVHAALLWRLFADTQWRHKSKKFWRYLKIWEWELIFGHAAQWRQFPHQTSIVCASHQTRRPCKLKTLQTYKQFTKKFAIMKVAKGKINKFLQGLNWFLKHGKLYIHTVKSRAVDWSTIQFWIFLS